MWTDTDLARRLGIAYPIIQGPLGGGLSPVPLVAAVSHAGGLGSCGASGHAPQEISDAAAGIRARTDKPFAINLWVPQRGGSAPNAEMVERALAWFAPYYRELGIAAPMVPAQFRPNFAAQVEAVLAAKPRHSASSSGFRRGKCWANAEAAASSPSAPPPRLTRPAPSRRRVSTPLWQPASKVAGCAPHS